MIKLTNISNFSIVPSPAPKFSMPFLNYTPDFARMEELAGKFGFIKKILVVGNGGSRNSFAGIYRALSEKHTPEVILIDTNEPEFLKKVSAKLNPKETLLLSISKSGDNVSQIEATLYFYDLPHKIFVTGPKGVLRDIAKADNTIEVVDHPDVGGRFAGLTEVALLPAMLCGFHVRDIFEGAQKFSESEGELAFQFAQGLWELEQKGMLEILLANYSHELDAFGNLIQQLFHESLGKDGKGLMVFPAASPEAQHHTNQRLFGGRKNMTAVFIKTKNGAELLKVPNELSHIPVRGKTLGDFNNLDLAKSLEAEYTGTASRCNELSIPNITVALEGVDSKAIGEYIRFWQMTTVYGAHLRNVDPYNQPEVEASKNISFNYRFDG